MHRSSIAITLFVVAALVGCKENRQPDRPPAQAREVPAEPTQATEQPEASQVATAASTAQRSPDARLEGPVMTDVTTLSWDDGPGSLPPGIEMVVLEGEPPFDEEETFVFALKAPPNYAIAPHVHAVTERVTMLQGEAFIGHGSTLDREAAMPVRRGGYAMMPAGHQHYLITRDGEATLVLQGVGPWAISYVNPEDDPRPSPPPLPDHESRYDVDVQASITNVDDVQWRDAPAHLLPDGAQIAMLEGDPEVDGKTFTMRIKMPDGYRVAPHSHGITDRFAVLSGALKVGMGDAWDEEGLQEYAAPSMVILPADQNHFVQADGETVIQVFGVGPYDIAWAIPSQDPALAESDEEPGERAAADHEER